MMMTKKLVWAPAILILAGCSIFEPSEAWKQAEVAQPLAIPAELDTPATSAEMQVPETTETRAVVEDKSPPVLDQSLNVPVPAELAWKQLGVTLESASFGTVLASDASDFSYRVAIRGADLITDKDRGFFSGLFHDGPDPDRDYIANVTVVGNGDQSTLQIDGDALAVMRLRELLQGGLLQSP